MDGECQYGMAYDRACHELVGGLAAPTTYTEKQLKWRGQRQVDLENAAEWLQSQELRKGWDHPRNALF